MIAIAQDSSTMMINLEKLDEIRTWKGDNPELHVTCCECSVDESLLALGTGSDGVFFLHLSENMPIVSSKLDANSSSPVRSIAIDGSKKIALGFDNGLISVSCYFRIIDSIHNFFYVFACISRFG